MPPLDASWMDGMPAVTLPGQPAASTPAVTPGAPMPQAVDTTPVTPLPGQSEVAARASRHPPTFVIRPGDGEPPATPPKPDTAWMDTAPAVRLPQDDLAAAQAKQAKGGIVRNLGAGTSEGTANFLGAPVDLATGALNLGIAGINAGARALGGGPKQNLSGLITGQAPPDLISPIASPFAGSDWWKSAEGLIGADPRNVEAQTQTERLARAGGEGLAGVMLPGGAARAVPKLAGAPEAIRQAIQSGTNPTVAAGGLTGGVAGQELEDSAPAPLKPLANLAGQVIGGGVPIAARAAGGAVTNALKPVVGQYIAPLTAKGQAGLAGQRIAGAASDPAAVREALSQPPRELVPGSEPTTYQATGDQGLGNLERGVAKNDSDPFIARAARQNQARMDVVGGLAPENASAATVPQLARNLMDALDAEHAGRLESAQAAHEAAQKAPPVPQTRLLTKAQKRAGAMGGEVPTTASAEQTALQGFGSRMQGSASARAEASKDAASKVWDAIDPDGTLAAAVGPLKAARAEILGKMTPESTPMDAETKRVFGVVGMLPDILPFLRLKTLRTQITNLIPELRQSKAPGSRENVARLGELLDGIHAAMEPAIQERVAQEARAVSAGTMTSADTLEATLRAQVKRFHELRAAESAATREGAGEGSGGTVRVGSADLRGRSGAAREAGGGPANPPRDQSLAANDEPLTPNWDAAATERYEAARGATREHEATYGSKALGVGEILKPGRFAGELATPASTVPHILFSPKGQAERIQNALKAGVSRQDLIDYATFNLRQAAHDADGTLNPTKGRAWLTRNNEAVTVLPEVRALAEPAIAAREAFDTATQHAQLARDAAEAQAKAQLKDVTKTTTAERATVEKSAIGNFLGDADPVARIGKILRSDTAAAQMRQLAQMTARNPAARAGLQKAVVEHIQNELQTNSLAGDTGVRQMKNDAFQTFVRKALPALGHIFDSKQIATIRDLAADIQRSQRSVTGTKLPSGSNTAQDLAAGAHAHGGRPSVVGLLIAAEAAGGVASHVGGPITRAGTMVGVGVLNAMRQAGLEKVNDLVTQAMLHPELARALLAKVPAGSFATPVLRNAARQIGALAGSSGAQQMRPRMAQ